MRKCFPRAYARGLAFVFATATWLMLAVVPGVAAATEPPLTCGTLTFLPKTGDFPAIQGVDTATGLRQVTAASDWGAIGLRPDGTLAVFPGVGEDQYPNFVGAVGQTGLAAVDCAYSGGCAGLKKDGSLVVWGQDGFDTTLLPVGPVGATQIAYSQRTVIALVGGKVQAWGEAAGKVPAGTPSLQIAAGKYSVAILRTDGTVQIVPLLDPMGDFLSPTWVTSVTPPSTFVFASIAYTDGLTAGVTAAGKVLEFPADGSIAAGLVDSLSGVVKTAMLNGARAAIRSDGTVAFWGGGAKDFVGTALSGVSDIVEVGGGLLAMRCPPACGAISDAGCCKDGLMTACVGGKLVSTNCTLGTCGWDAAKAGFACDVGNATGPFATSTTCLGCAVGQNACATGKCGRPVAFGSGVGNLMPAIPANVDNIKQVVVAGASALALRHDGTVASWSLDNSPLDEFATWSSQQTGIAQLAGGASHVVALKQDGTVTAHIPEAYALQGVDVGQATVPVGLTGVTQVAAGQQHSVALRADGTVAAWGFNKSVVGLDGKTGVKYVAVGFGTTGLILADGSVDAFVTVGDEFFSAAIKSAIPAGLKASRLAIGRSHAMAVSTEGKAVLWGNDFNGTGTFLTAPADLGEVLDVAAGEGISLARKLDGTLVYWGSPGAQIVLPKVPVSGFAWSVNSSFLQAGVAWACPGNCEPHTTGTGCCLGDEFKTCENGQLVKKTCAPGTCGWNSTTNSYSCNTPGAADPALVFDKMCWQCKPKCDGKQCGPDGCGGTCGICDGYLACNEATGQCPACTKDCVGKDCDPKGCSSPCGLVKTIGFAGNGGGAIPAKLKPVKTGRLTYFGTIVLHTDGTMTGWGNDVRGQFKGCNTRTNISTFDTGIAHVVAVKKDGTVEAWGWNDHGEATVPVGLAGAVAAAAAPYVSVVLKADGSVVAWGKDEGGNVSQMNGQTGVQFVAAALGHTALIRKDGSVVVMGQNKDLTSIPAGLKAVQIDLTEKYAIALKPDGTVVAWGSAKNGVLAVPAGLADVVSIAAAEDAAAAVTKDGKLVAWGDPDSALVLLTTNKAHTGLSRIDAGYGCEAVLATYCSDDCESVAATGCCSGATFRICNADQALFEMTCASGKCGWNAATGQYGCGPNTTSAPGQDLPRLCGGACVPVCAGKQCGDDGCGGICGTCSAGLTCMEDTGDCVCVPQCAGKACGDDGCGGSCGQCASNEACGSDFQCQCVPQCNGKACGSDGCGGACGTCGVDEQCNASGQCECKPQCDGKTCGPDGCGGFCGFCDASTQICMPDQTCCSRQCTGKDCGDDGCGGTCGDCSGGQTCGADGKCFTKCEPNCLGKQCGDDGCGGSCGTCTDGFCDKALGICKNNVCPNLPQAGCCVGNELQTCATFTAYDGSTAKQEQKLNCGDKGLFCGWDATAGAYGCVATPAPEDPAGKWARGCSGIASCTPNCTGRICGDDGCGGSCGDCPSGNKCDFVSGQCKVDVCAVVPGPGCCAGNTLIRCNNGVPEQTSCSYTASIGGQCGWAGSSYSCDAKGLDSGDPQFPKACPAGVCQPYCGSNKCGGDGCGGSCGTCPAGLVCNWGSCEPPCQPKCAVDSTKPSVPGKKYDCGNSDGCGGSCGCPSDMECQVTTPYGYGKCVPKPKNECGDVEQPCCDGNKYKKCVLNKAGTVKSLVVEDCAATPGNICTWKSNGANGPVFGCGTVLYTDPTGASTKYCKTCTPSCAGKVCGDDGCGGSCGTCPNGGVCHKTGQCIGPEGCGGAPLQGCCDGNTRRICIKGSPKDKAQVYVDDCQNGCGWNAKTQNYSCYPTNGPTADPAGTPMACGCIGSCWGKSCGDDGCGGSCGACADGKVCTPKGSCCVPQCDGKQCGDNGCGGQCGTCGAGTECDVDKCVASPPPATCANTPWQGNCKGETLQFCSGNQVLTEDCSKDKSCGWNAAIGAYSCGTSGGTDPSGVYPKAAPGTKPVCTPQCNGKQCGDNGCGGSCGSCVNGAICGSKGLCEPDLNLKKWYTPSNGCCYAGGKEMVQKWVVGGVQPTACAAGEVCGKDPVTFHMVCAAPGNVLPPKADEICQDCGTCAGKKPCETNACGQLCGGCKPSTQTVCNYGTGLCEKPMGGASCDGLCGQPVNPLWPCQCDAACASRGDCCGNYDAWCGTANPKPNACGNKKCDSDLGESCSTCASDCGACVVPSGWNPPWASPYAQAILAAGTAVQQAWNQFNPLDWVLPAPPPYPTAGLVAHVASTGTRSGPPMVAAVSRSLKAGSGSVSTVPGAQGSAWAFGSDTTPFFASQNLVLEERLPRRPFVGNAVPGGFSVSFWFRVPKTAAKETNALLSLPMGDQTGSMQTCAWTRKGDSKVTVTCPALVPNMTTSATIQTIHAYYGSTDGTATPDGKCGKAALITSTYRCQNAAAAELAAAACLGKSSCEIDVASLGNPCAGTPDAARLVVKATCDYTVPASTLAIATVGSAAGPQLNVLSAGNAPMVAETPLVPDAWHHVAMTYQPYPPSPGLGARTLYLDGQLVGTDPAAGQPFFDEVVLGAARIPGLPQGGATAAGDSVGSLAHMDDVFVYDRALTDSEVRSLQAKRSDGVVRVWPTLPTARVATQGLGIATGKATEASVAASQLIDPTSQQALATPGKALGLGAGVLFRQQQGDADLANLTTWTLAGWVRPAALAAGKPLLKLVKNGSAEASITLDAACGGRALAAQTSAGKLPAATTCEHGAKAGEWLFVALVQKTLSTDLYVDGYLMASMASGGSPLFQNAGVQSPAGLEVGDGVDLAWAALFSRAVPYSELAQYRTPGPAVWLDGARHTEGTASLPRDYAAFRNATGGADLDKPQLRTYGGAKAQVSAGSGPLVLSATSGVGRLTIPARGRLQPLGPSGVQAFSWTGRVRLESSSPASIPLVEKVTGPAGAAVNAPVFRSALLCKRVSSPKAEIACTVEVTALKADGSWAKWGTATRSGPLTAPSQAFDLSVALSFDGTAPKVAFGTDALVAKGLLAMGPGAVKVSALNGPIAPPAPITLQDGPTAPFLGMSAPVGGTVSWQAIKLYNRVLTELELVRLLAQTCAAVDCKVGGALCAAPLAGAVPVCNTCDIQHLDASSEPAAMCVGKLPFLSPCQVDAQCASNHCGMHGYCATTAIDTTCQAGCDKLGRTCVLKFATTPEAYTTCSDACQPYHEPPKSGLVTDACSWNPPFEPGEVCDKDDECKVTGVCLKSTEPKYEVDVNWSPTCAGGKCPYWVNSTTKAPIGCNDRFDMAFLADLSNPNLPKGTCPLTATASSKDVTSGRCASKEAPDCAEQHRQSIVHKGKGLDGGDIVQCGACDPTTFAGQPMWVKRWRMLSPQLCRDIHLQAAQDRIEGKSGPAQLVGDITLSKLAMFVLGKDANAIITPKDMATMISKGVGAELIDIVFDDDARAKWYAEYPFLSLHDCQEETFKTAGKDDRVSPYFDDQVNYQVCAPNQYPDGTPCPPPGVDPSLADQFCQSGFCARDTHVCEEGYGKLEEVEAGDKNDKKDNDSGDDSVGAVALVERNNTVAKFNRIKPSVPGQPKERTYSIAVKNVHELKVFGATQEIFGVSTVMSGNLDAEGAEFQSEILLMGFSIPNPPEPASGCPGATWEDGEYVPPPSGDCTAKLPDPSNFELSLPAVSLCFPSPGGCEEDAANDGLKKYNEKGPMCYKAVTFVGPVPITMEAGVTIDACLSMGTGVDDETFEPSFEVTPSIGVNLGVKGGVGGSVGVVEIFAGVQAAITIVELGFPIKWALAVAFGEDESKDPKETVPNLFVVKYNRTVELTLTLLKLSLSAFAEAAAGPLTIAYEYGLFEFEGIALSWTLDDAELWHKKIDFEHKTANQ